MKITGAIFDFDGTLFDSMHIWGNVGETYLKHIGFEAAVEMSPVFLNLSLRNAVKMAKEKFGIERDDEEIAKDVYKHLTERYLTEAKPKNDIIPFLDKLKSAGVKMCIATATDEEPVSAALREYDMLGYFEKIFTASNVGKGKGDPKMFREALKFLGTDKNTTWIFEDALYSAKTAKRDGFNVVGIYDKSEPAAEEMKSTADIYICNFSELQLE